MVLMRSLIQCHFSRHPGKQRKRHPLENAGISESGSESAGDDSSVDKQSDHSEVVGKKRGRAQIR